MLVPNRHGQADSYRYGFQGQEKDDEVKGEGNSINYKFRMHDPRVGRFFATDPLTSKYPHYTPYSFSGNKVIAFGELEGLEEYSVTTAIDWVYRNYAVQKGDNLSTIAKTTNVSLSEILKFNPNLAKNPDLIYEGQVIELKDPRLKESLFSRPKGDLIPNKLSRIGRAKQLGKEVWSGRNGVKEQGEALFYTALSGMGVGGIAQGSLRFFAAQSFKRGSLGALGSATGQAVLYDGEVNISGAIGDGYLTPIFGNTLGSALEMNFNLKTGKFNTSKTIFGDKSLSTFGLQSVIGIGTDKRAGALSKYMTGNQGQDAASFIFNFGNKMLNKGIETGVKNVGGSSSGAVVTPRDISGSNPDVDRKD